MDWKTMLTYISGSVDEELLLRRRDRKAAKRFFRKLLKGQGPSALAAGHRQTEKLQCRSPRGSCRPSSTTLTSTETT